MRSKSHLLAVLVVAAWFSQASGAVGQSGETPLTITGAKTVSTDDVKALLGKVTIFDVRRKASYVEGHIPGAKSIVGHFNSDNKTFESTAFGPSKHAAIVIHGHGTDGWSAVYAVNSAVAAGFKDVRWMRGGWADWSAKKLPTEH